MKFTTLYLHDSTACWMQWRGRRLLQVYCESVTRELAERAAASSKKDGIPSLCPWLSVHASQVRLLIDPVTDQTRSIPAFDHGFAEPSGYVERFRQGSEQAYLTFRALTCDVLADDLTRYRHDRLIKHPNALLQWHQAARIGAKSPSTPFPRHWIVSESGLSDYVFSWLNAMADRGLEFVDVRPVSGLFASEDANCLMPVITIIEQANRCRLIQCHAGFVTKVEQWSNSVEARIALEERIAELAEDEKSVQLRYIGSDEGLIIWQEAIASINIIPRTDGVLNKANFTDSISDDLPSACLHLPLNALLRSKAKKTTNVWMQSPKWESGASIRELLSTAKWKRRYKRTVIATTVTAVFSGYLVLLAGMHAIRVIELHERANDELSSLNERRLDDQLAIAQLTKNSSNAVESINRLLSSEEDQVGESQVFLKSLAQLLVDQPHVVLSSVSWRLMATNDDESSLTVLARVNELVDAYKPTPSLEGSAVMDAWSDGSINERIVLISGDVVSVNNKELSQQQVSDSLIGFLQALTTTDQVVDVVPIVDSLMSAPRVNLPSDVVVSSNGDNGFIVAVRISV